MFEKHQSETQQTSIQAFRFQKNAKKWREIQFYLCRSQAITLFLTTCNLTHDVVLNAQQLQGHGPAYMYTYIIYIIIHHNMYALHTFNRDFNQTTKHGSFDTPGNKHRTSKRWDPGFTACSCMSCFYSVYFHISSWFPHDSTTFHRSTSNAFLADFLAHQSLNLYMLIPSGT